MRVSTAFCLSFATSALAYQVTEPSSTQGWSPSGPQTLSWVRVDTDPSTFTAVLVNEDRSVMPQNNQVLAAQVDGTLKTVAVNPPSGGWPQGGSFRVNFVKDPNNLDTILAQSNDFTIGDTSGSTSSSRTTHTSSTPSGTTSATHALSASGAFSGTTAITNIVTSTGNTPSATPGNLEPNSGTKILSLNVGLALFIVALCLSVT